MKKILLLLTVSLIGFTSCQQNDTEFVSTQTQPSAVDESILDDQVIASLSSYDLKTSDFYTEISTGLGTSPSKSASDSRRRSQVTQKSLTIGDETIAYFETSGRGPDIVMVHGLSQACNTFDLQMNSVLGRVFHIVAIDLPGHGMSANSIDPGTNYQLPGYASLLTHVVEELHLEHAVFVGWSLGANIIMEAADDLPQAAGFMLYDVAAISNPFDPNAFLPLPEFPLLLKPDITEAEIQAVIPTFFRPNAHYIPEFFFDNMRRQDANARLYLGVTIGTANYKDEPGELNAIGAPVALAIGKEEQIINGDYMKALDVPTLWHGQVWELPCAGHASHWEQPVLFNILLAAFTIDCNFHHHP